MNFQLLFLLLFATAQSCFFGIYFYDNARIKGKQSSSLLFHQKYSHCGFIKGILRGVRCTKSLRVLFLHRRPPSWTTLVLYSRAVFIFNEPAFILKFIVVNQSTLRSTHPLLLSQILMEKGTCIKTH